ncbi:hypothetical protein D1007_49613 [Hordeum vulgare]|nr:hypothetical protein D1007_49613 [Hordeum vulgare]
MVLLRFGVTFLIEHPLQPNASPHLLEVDAHITLWIYVTLTDPLVDHVINATTTYTLEENPRFLPCQPRRRLHALLNRQYRNLKQGDLSVTKYARRMKLLTDGLADIGYAVTEMDHTTQFLHNLDKRLDMTRVVLGD